MSEADEIRDLYHQYVEAQHRGDIEAVASLCTENVLLIPPEQQPLIGRAEIYKLNEGSANSAIELDPTHIEIEGNLAWVTGLIHWDADGQRRSSAFIDVWRRQNGEWRIAACTWNSSNGISIA